MKSKLYILSFAVVAFSLSALNGQSLSSFQRKLEFQKSGDPLNTAQVTLRQDNSARLALTELESRTPQSSVEGYRIGIFFDNGASARANAMDVVKECKKLFGDIPTTMTYDNPYFKVSAGYYIDSEEAIMALNRVQRDFPKAYLMREQITPENLKLSWDQEVTNKKNNPSYEVVDESELN